MGSEESEPKVSITWRESESRFSSATGAAFSALRDELWSFGRRLSHIRSVHAELVKVGRLKRFEIHHEPMWAMLLSERDMIVVDLASWAKALYSAGGFLKLNLQGPDLEALGWRWRAGKLQGSVDPIAEAIDREITARNLESRKEAFARLFPGATKDHPSRQDVEGLEGRLRDRFKPLLEDRHQHRAHKYEQHAKTATAEMLTPEKVAEHLAFCQSIVADLGSLATNAGFHAYRYGGEAKDDDDEAKDVVDLILCGTINWILEFGPGGAPAPEGRFYWLRRTAYYERLHTRHDARGKPDEPFNALLDDAGELLAGKA